MKHARELNAQMVEHLKKSGVLHSPAVEQAMLATPRHLFIPQVALEEAYQDRAIPTKRQENLPISSCSQPAIVAIMLEQLDLRAGMNVLEIGAGTGYNASLMSQLVGPSGQITTIDIDDDIVAEARAHLQAAEVDNVRVVCADGGEGFAARAPYDRIILTVGAWDISPAWLAQLRAGGVLELPLWMGARQYALAFEKVNDHLRSRSMQLCGFMALRGSFAGPNIWLAVGDYVLGGEAVATFEPESLSALLAHAPHERRLSESDFSLSDLLDDLWARGERVVSLAPLKAAANFPTAFGLASDDGRSLALLAAKDNQSCEPAPQALVFGDDRAWTLLLAQIARFRAEGAPSLARGTVEVYPRGSAPQGERVVAKRWMEYVLKPAYLV